MANFGHTLKNVLTRSAKFVGSTASRLAKATKFKTNELTELSKRRDLVNVLGEKVYDLSHNGLVLPEEAAALVHQIAALDNELAVLRADHAAQKAADAQQRAAEKAARAAEKAATKAAAAIEQSTAPVAVNIPELDASDSEVVSDTASVPTLNVEVSAEDASATEEVPTLNV